MGSPFCGAFDGEIAVGLHRWITWRRRCRQRHRSSTFYPKPSQLDPSCAHIDAHGFITNQYLYTSIHHVYLYTSCIHMCVCQCQCRPTGRPLSVIFGSLHTFRGHQVLQQGHQDRSEECHLPFDPGRNSCCRELPGSRSSSSLVLRRTFKNHCQHKNTFTHSVTHSISGTTLQQVPVRPPHVPADLLPGDLLCCQGTAPSRTRLWSCGRTRRSMPHRRCSCRKMRARQRPPRSVPVALGSVLRGGGVEGWSLVWEMVGE